MLVSCACIAALPRLSCHQDSGWPPSSVLYPPHGYATCTAAAHCGHHLKPVGWKWLKFWVLQLISVVLRFHLLLPFCSFTAGKRDFTFCLSMVGHCLWLSALAWEAGLEFFIAWHLALTQPGLLAKVFIYTTLIIYDCLTKSYPVNPKRVLMLLGKSIGEQTPETSMTLFWLLLCSPLKLCFNPINKSKCWKSAVLMR